MLDTMLNRLYREAYGDLEKRVLTDHQVIPAAPGARPRNCSLGEGSSPLSGMSQDEQRIYAQRVLPMILRCIRAQRLSVLSLDDNRVQPRVDADAALLEDIRDRARMLGADAVGHVRVPKMSIFADKGILYDSALVLAGSMDRERMAPGSGLAATEATFENYAELGELANGVAAYLRRKGLGAQAGMALGGVTFYPQLAEMAGMGARGRHGLVISPAVGPGQRFAVVYHSLRNLPAPSPNPHRWVKDFCTRCLNCIRLCPAGAIYPEPVSPGGGRKTFVDAEKCRTYFYDNHGCAICVAECPFFLEDYHRIRDRV